MDIPSFVFGGNTGINSPGELERNRRIAEALQIRAASRVPQNPWEGLNAVTAALASRTLGERADLYEQQQRDEADAAFKALLGEDNPSMGAMADLAGNDFLGDGKQAVINAMLANRMAPPPAPEYGFTFAPDGTMIRTDKTGGGVEEMGSYAEPESADPTSAMQNYEFLVSQGIDPQTALQRAFSGGVNVNVGEGEVGTIPSGFELITDPETGARRMQPIPGGPAALEAEQAAQREASKAGTASLYGNVVIEDIDRALEKIAANPELTTGPIGAITEGVSGLPAHDVNKLITTVKANAGFDRLQAMRDASPTGGALGQVSERELDFLNSAIGNLEQSQSMPQLVENLQRVRRIYTEIVHGPEAAAQMSANDLPQGVTEEDVQFTMEKHGLTREQVLERIRNAR